MKKIVGAVTVALTAALALSGCGRGETVATPGAPVVEGGAAAGTQRVLIASSDQANPFYSWLTNSTEAYFAQNFPNVETTVVDLRGNDANVPSVIEQAIVGGYNGLILDKVNADQPTDELLQNAHADGVNTVLVNNSGIEDGVSSSSGASNFLLGEKAGEIAAAMLPPNAKILVILSTPGNSGSEDRWAGIQQGLASRDDIEILDVSNANNWAKENAIRLMDDWLQIHPEIDGVIAVNDGMALGAIEAAKAAGRDVQEMMFFGIDGLADACISIEAGELTASILQDANDMGANAARIVMGMIDGSITTPEEYFITPIVITKDNVDEVIAMHQENGFM